MEGGVIPGVDSAKLRAQAQAAAEQTWDTLADWDRSAARTNRPVLGPIRSPSNSTRSSSD